MFVAVDSDTDDARASLADVPRWFDGWECNLSRFLPDSDLARLNHGAGGDLQAVSPVLWEVIDAAMVAARDSDGLVSPTLLNALETAGYNRSFDQLASSGASATVSEHVAVADWRTVQRDFARRAVGLPADVGLDLGGIAKGWAADQAARRLSAIGPALVDAGGDIAVSGPQADGSPWPIAVDDPFHQGQDMALVLLPSGAVATSGRDYRRWNQGGVPQHHIIDPRTGRPAETDVLSATVIAPTTQAAEVAAKVALILGSRAGMVWINSHPDLAALLVTADGRVTQSSRMHMYLWSSHGYQYFTA